MKDIYIKTPHGRVWMKDDNITRTSWDANTLVSVEDAWAHLEAGKKINETRGLKRSPLLVDLSNIKSLSREVRLIFSGEATMKVCIAAALLIKSSMSRIIGNFFLGLNKSIYPVKLFSSEEEALKWLINFKKERIKD